MTYYDDQPDNNWRDRRPKIGRRLTVFIIIAIVAFIMYLAWSVFFHPDDYLRPRPRPNVHQPH